MMLTCNADGLYLYYPIWPRSSRRRKATGFITTSPKAPASMANRGSSTSLISVLPRKWRRCSKTVPPRSQFPLPRESLGFLALSGWHPGKPVCLPCSSRSGPRRAPDPRQPIMCCWLRSSASVRRDRRPQWPPGIAAPFRILLGDSRRSASDPKTSGMRLSKSSPSTWSRFAPAKIPSIRPNCACLAWGKKSSW